LVPDGRPPLSAVTGVRLASTDHAAVAVCTCRRRVNGQLVLLAGIISVNAKESAMAMGDKIKHAAEEAGGKVKEATGKATDNRDLEAEGHGDQASANVKQAGDKAKDAVGDVLNH